MRTSVVGIDRIVCVGRGLCAGVLPERISLDEWGYPIIDPTPMTSGAVAEAVRICPVGALYLRSSTRTAPSGAATTGSKAASSGR